MEQARNSCKRAGGVVKKRQIPASGAGMTLGYVRQDLERVFGKEHERKKG